MFKTLIATICILLISSANTTAQDTYTIRNKDGIKHIHNKKPKWGDEQKLTLEFVQKIGEMDSDDENYMFFRPADADIGPDGNIYIFESGDQQIKKFSPDGKYLATIGGPGQGPDEFDNVMEIEIDDQGNIYAPYSFHQIKVLDPNGKYLNNIYCEKYYTKFDLSNSGNFVFGLWAMAEWEGSGGMDFNLIGIVDKEGKLQYDFCKPIKDDELLKFASLNYLRLVADSKDNVIISFNHQNRIEKYNNIGGSVWTMDRDLPYDLEYKAVEREMMGRTRTMHEFTRITLRAESDSKNRIWNLFYKRQFEKGLKPSDYLEFEVFDEDGILLTHVPIPDHSTGSFQISGDTIFFLDAAETSSVFQYRIVEK
ncbi:6-bladed beta-propeller [candidate division KSB1 bacterium]